MLLTGFEAVLLALYGAETKARGGRPVMINIPDLGHASLYHSPRQTVGSAQPVSPLSPTILLFIGTHVHRIIHALLPLSLPLVLLLGGFARS